MDLNLLSLPKLLKANGVFFMFLLFLAGQTCAQEREFLPFSESAMRETLVITEPELLLRQRRSVTVSVNDSSTSSSSSPPTNSSSSSSPESTVEPESSAITNATEFIDMDASESAMSSTVTSETTTVASTPKSSPITPQPTTTVFNTTTIRDNHQYYVSHIYNEPALTTPYLEEFKKKFVGIKPSHDFLRKAIGRVKLFKSNFDFLFYGHSMRDVAITTGGFLYMSDFLHPHITHSQYIAPLMGQFHTKENSSDIYHVDDGSAFWVQWKNLYLNGKESAGPFTFYTVIQKNGTIIFAYEKLSILPKDITGTRRIGLSDAFYQDVTLTFNIRIRRIYRYHAVEINSANIRDGTVIVIDPLLTCHQLMTCTDCVSGRSSFKCSWCPAVSRCSSGIDRHRQDWVRNLCHRNTSPSRKCSTRLSSPMTAGIVFIVLILVASVVGLAMWCRYAYVHPTSPSGIWLMEHRPSVIKQKMTSMFRSDNPGERYQVSFNAQESVA